MQPDASDGASRSWSSSVGSSLSDDEPTSSDVLDQLDQLQPLHRAVLVLRYVDDLSVPEVATAIGRNLTPTNSLLARARAELRRVSGDDTDG